MKKSFFPLIICIIILLAGCATIKIDNAGNGHLDLSHRDFNNSTVIKMRGEWKIVWGEFLDPLKDKASIDSIPDTVDVPKTWSSLNLSDGNNVGSKGYGTLVLNVKTPADITQLAIETTYITSSFDIYANGRKIASNGVIGKDSASTKAAWRPTMGSFDNMTENTQIVIHFANFNHRRFVIKDLYIGSKDAIESHMRNRIAMDLITFGGILLMGVYHLFIYLLRRRDMASMYFSLLCFSFALRTLMVGNRFIYMIFPNIQWEIFMKIAYISVYFMAYFLMKFVCSTFTKHRIKIFEIFMTISTASVVMTTFIFPARIFDILLVPYEIIILASVIYQLYMIIRAVLTKEVGSVLMLMSNVILLLAGINDSLYEYGIIGTTSLTPFALLALIMAQSFILAKRFTYAYNSSEFLLEENRRINKELNDHNEQLEIIIEKRTHEINEMNEELQVSNEELVELVSQINRSEAHFRSLFENMPIGVFRFSKFSGFQMANPKLAEILGFDSPSQLISAVNEGTYKMISSPDTWDDFLTSLTSDENFECSRQFDMVRKDGKKIIAEVTHQIVDQDSTGLYCEGTIIDISDRILLENKLKSLASVDSLTGLNNRRVFSEKLHDLGTGCSLALLDIDDFKTINDTFGHDGGDAVLKNISKHLKDICSDEIFASRIGGEEFALIFDSQCTNPISILQSLRRTIESQSIRYLDKQIKVTISIGLYNIDTDSTGDEIFRVADSALYSAKSKGKNQIQIAENLIDEIS